jgi:hypothetical protein
LLLHIHNLSAFVKFRRKPIHFVVYVKMTKIVIYNALFLALNFIFLHTPHDTRFVVQRLCGHVAREDIFDILKYVFQNIGSICS